MGEGASSRLVLGPAEVAVSFIVVEAVADVVTARRGDERLHGATMYARGTLQLVKMRIVVGSLHTIRNDSFNVSPKNIGEYRKVNI